MISPQKKNVGPLSCDESKTHMDALAWWHFTKAVRQRKSQVVENQIRTVVGIVKTKSAAQSYETRIAELQMSGADVGDFGHGRNQFVHIIKAASEYITNEIQCFLSLLTFTSQLIRVQTIGLPIRCLCCVQL